MTYAPQDLLDLRAYLHGVTGLSNSELGIVGDSSHDGGYHCGWDKRRIRNGKLADYSWQDSGRDMKSPTDAASAIDIGNFALLRALSNWLVNECANGATDCASIRSIIYSPDGKVVRRWDRLKLRSGGDESHLWHTHVSYFRDTRSQDKTGPFRRFFEGEAMTPEEIAHAVWEYRPQYPDFPNPLGYRAGQIHNGTNNAVWSVVGSNKSIESKVDALAVGGVDVAALAAALAPLLVPYVEDAVAKMVTQALNSTSLRVDALQADGS